MIANDALKVYHCLTCGENVNTKIGPWGEAQLREAWKSCSIVDEIQIPFFLASHPDQSLRPSYLHVAIYFNAISVIELLVEQNVNISNESVWFGSVEIANDQLSSLGNPKNKSIFSMHEFIDFIYGQGLHRIILNMDEFSWRKRCNQIRGKLLHILQPRIAEFGQYEEIDDINMIRDVKVESEAEFLQRTSNRKASMRLTRAATIAANVRSMSISYRRTVMKTTMLDSHQNKFSWREHSIVRKLQGEPLVASLLVDDDEQIMRPVVHYLGKEDVWLRLTTHPVESSSYQVSNVANDKKKTMAERKAQFLQAVQARADKQIFEAQITSPSENQIIEIKTKSKDDLLGEAYDDDDIIGQMTL